MSESAVADVGASSPSAEVGSSEVVSEIGSEAVEKAKWDGKFLMKVDGEESTLDLNDDGVREKIHRRLQKESAAEKHLALASEVNKQMQELQKLAKEDKKAVDVLEKLGLTREEIYAQLEEDYYQKKTFEELPKEQQEKIKAQKEYEEIMAKKKAIEDEVNQHQTVQLVEQATDIMAKGLDQLVGDAGLGTYDDYIGVIRHAIEIYEEHTGEEDIPLKLIVEDYKKQNNVDHTQELISMVKKMPIEDLMKVLGRDNEIRKFFLDKTGTVPNSKVIQADKKKEDVKKYLTPSEMEANALKRMGLR